MKVQSRTGTPKTEVTMTKKAKVTIFFRPTVLHDHAASRLVKNLDLRMYGNLLMCIKGFVEV